jgi:flagellar biogenesis protein FliO
MVVMQTYDTLKRPFWALVVMRRAQLWLRGQSVAARRMRHLETLPLGTKRSLYLVECDGSQFLVAAGGDSVSAPVLIKPANATYGVVSTQQEDAR